MPESRWWSRATHIIQGTSRCWNMESIRPGADGLSPPTCSTRVRWKSCASAELRFGEAQEKEESCHGDPDRIESGRSTSRDELPVRPRAKAGQLYVQAARGHSATLVAREQASDGDPQRAERRR